MKKTEIDALVRAHRGRARPVAFLHILRQPALEEDDHTFLREHDRELTVVDLLRWRARCPRGFTASPIRALSRIAQGDPGQFEHELLNVSGLSLDDEEWVELADLLRGKVPEALLQRILDRGRGRPAPMPAAPAPPPEEADTLADLFDDIADAPPSAPAPPVDAALAPELVLERARNAFSAEERAALLAWLAARDVPRGELLPIAFTAVRAGELSPELSAFIAASLKTRAAWEEHGLDCFLAYLDRGALSELSDLCADAYSRISASSSAKRSGDAAKGLVTAMHAAFAGGLVAAAREALVAAQHARALGALAALTCLDPPSRLSRAVHDLGRVAGDDADVRELFELNLRLIKHGRGREASFEGLVAAIHTLADAL